MVGFGIALIIGAALGATIASVILAVVSKRLKDFELKEEEDGKESN